MSERIPYFAACISGTEQALCDELRELDFSSVRLNRGGIPFMGTREDGWRACLTSRIAQRIQELVGRFPAPDESSLYQGVLGIDWGTVLTPEQTFSVQAVTRGSRLNHSGFIALKAKDAIVDQIRERCGTRPSVARDDPDVRIVVYVASDKASVYLDLSGEPLHRRGYRIETGEAPLRETLAAAVLRLSGWDRQTPLLDPLCGSGTLAIEAGLWVEDRAPGLTRACFGFQRRADFGPDQAHRLREMKGELRRGQAGRALRIQASDRDAQVLEKARNNARAAGVKISFKERSVLDVQASDQRMHVVVNPPYGQRLDLDPDFPRLLGTAISRWHGWRVSILAGSRDYLDAIPLRPEEPIPLKNGDLECRLLNYEVP